MLFPAAVSSGCAGRTVEARAGRAPPAPSLHSVVACLTRTGADVGNLTTNRDLRVSVGEVGVSFSSFDAYVGVAADRREATAAAGELDRQTAVLQQAGHGVVRGAAVFYFDAPIVPRAGARLVEACLAGSADRATAAMGALARALPLVQLPSPLEQRVVARCRTIAGGRGSCTCVYERAARLFSYGQVDGLGRTWARARARAAFAGLMRTCEPTSAATRL